MNIENTTQLPFLKLGRYNCLVDSGSTRSFINPKIIKDNPKEFKLHKQNFTLSTAHGISKGNNYVILHFKNI